MHSPMPFLRLVNRPTVWLGWAWVTWMFVMTSVSAPDQTTMLPMVAWADPAGPWFWRLTIAIPAASGLVVSFVRMDLFKGSFPWLLPGLTSRVSLALVVLGGALSLPMAAVALAAGYPSVAAAAFGLGLLSFATGSVFMETFTSLMVVVAVALGASWYFAPQLGPIAVEYPVMLAVLALSLAWWVYRHWHGRDAVRELQEFLRVPHDSRFLQFLQRDDVRSTRAVSLHDASNLTWARSTIQENPFRNGRNLALTFGLFVGLEWWGMPSGAASFMSTPLFAFSCLFFPIIPRRDGLYPLSRMRRAAVNWLAAAITAVTFCFLIVAWTLAFEWVIGTIRGEPEVLIQGRGRALAFQLVWYPVLLWPAIRRGLGLLNWVKDPSSSYIARFVWMTGAMLVFGVLVEASASLLGRLDSTVLQIISGLLLAVAVQVVFYAALRRYFLTGDLR